MRRRFAITAVACCAWLLPSTAHADATFRWSVPERLQGDGRDGAARSIASATAASPTVIALRTCADHRQWRLDGDDVRPVTVGRCAFRLDLGDHEPHELTLQAQDETITQTVQARDLVVVSIGDSVASGEGNPDSPSVIGGRWLEPRCHRSMRSGAAQAVLALAAGDPHSSITFLPLACSGAQITTGLLRPYRGVQPDRRRGDLPAQVEQLAELARTREIDAVLLSVGANDVFFGPLATFCARATRCPERRFDPERVLREAADPDAPTAQERHAGARRALPGRYDDLARALQKAGVPPDRVIVVEYFDPTQDELGDTCSALLPGISVAESEWAQDTVLRALNAEVRNSAQRHEWKLVSGVQDAFANHGICARGQQRWVRRIDESLRRGSGLSGPLHPNSAGHLATAALITPVLASVVGVDPGAGVAQTGGAADNEGNRVAWWWLLIAVAGAALITLVVEHVVWPRRSSS